MKQLSEQTRLLVSQLAHMESWSGRLLSPRGRQAQLLRDIGASGEPGAIQAIVPYAIAGGPMAVVAAEALSELVRHISDRDLVHLRLGMSSNISELRSDKVADLCRFGEFCAELLGVVATHWNGHVREAAVRSLSDIRSGRELPFLLISVNDWVPQVRNRAAAAVRDRLDPAHAAHFVRYIQLVTRLEECSRASHVEIVESIKSLLQSPVCLPELLKGTTADEPLIRRTCYRIAAESPAGDRRSILREAMCDHSNAIRFWAVREVTRTLLVDELLDELTKLERDPFPAIRSAVLDAYAATSSPLAVDAWMIALLDVNAGVRATARHYLRKTVGIDFATFYRERIATASGRELEAAVSGLCDVATTSDAMFVAPYAFRGKSRLRKTVMRALSFLDRPNYAVSFARLLADESASVSREAKNILAMKPRLLTAEQLWAVFGASKFQHVMRNAISLLSQTRDWDSAVYLLEACASSDDAIAQSAEEGLSRWVRTSATMYSEPTSEQAEQIRKGLTDRESRIDAAVLGMLRFAVRE